MTSPDINDSLHSFLDFHYGENGDRDLQRALQDGADPEARVGEIQETALHVATRRRRLEAVRILIQHGVDINATTAGGKTAYQHALRRGFDEVADYLSANGADTTLSDADRLAVAMSRGQMDEARSMLQKQPELARTGNPEEDRLLADLSGRPENDPVRLLIDAGADLSTPGLDDGTPLHTAAWFGQPENARSLVEAGAPLDVFDRVHTSSPLHWAIHGSRYSGGVEGRQDAYVAVTTLLLEAGSSLTYPNDDSDAYWKRLMMDASDPVRQVLGRWASR